MNDSEYITKRNTTTMFIIRKSEIVNRLDPMHLYSINKNKQDYLYKTEKLSSITVSFSGGTPSKDQGLFWNGIIPWASAKDFKDFYIIDTEDTITELGLEFSSTKIVPSNSLVMVVRSGILKHTLPTAVNLKEITINQDIKAFIPCNGISAKYLNSFFFVFNTQILPLVVKHGKTVQSVNTEELGNLRIPIPPYNIQNLIVSLIDDALEVVKQKEEFAKLLYSSIDSLLLKELQIDISEKDDLDDELIDGRLNKSNQQVKNGRIFLMQYKDIAESRLDPIFYFTNIRKYTNCTYSERLSSLAYSFINGFAVGRQDQVEEGEGILQIRPTNIDNNGQLKYDRNVYVPEMKDIPFVESDVVLFNNTNSQEWVGKTAYFANEENRKVYTSNHITAIEVDRSKILPEYLCAILNMYQRHKIFYSICTNWNNQSGVGLDLLKSLYIPLFTDDRKESLRKQQEIVDKIKAIYQEADECVFSANQVMSEAKAKVESMIVG